MKSSASQIRLRLLLLLGSVFVGVLLLVLFLFPVITAYFLTNFSETASPRFPILGYLEGYYFGHGGWDGVESVFQYYNDFPPEYTLLLDKDDRVVLDGGAATASTVGSVHEHLPREIDLPLTSNGERVGTLVVKSLPLSWRGRFASGILLPVFLVSLVLALFMVVVAYLLMRRFVNPLADVIYAARLVADGKLDTRIEATGPRDLHSLSDSFNEMAAALERNDRERRDLLADIAHELRTPLTVIRGRLEGIVDGVYAEPAAPVSTALEQTYLLQRLVDDLRLLSLAESRQLHFEFKPVDLANLSQHVLDLFQAEAQERRISISLEHQPGDFVIQADAQRTEQVIANLVGNALRYIPEGGRVWIRLTADDRQVALSVNDNGAGIPEADLPFIFDRFWRKEKSRSRLTGGTGLGLAIAKHLIEAQGGTIRARNLSEGGLQMIVTFNK